MVSLKLLLALTSSTTIFALPSSPSNKSGCGELNIIFTGLPPYHPLVITQGFDPAIVNSSLRADAAAIIATGYNLRVVLMGPEQKLGVLADQVDGVSWDGTGIGYGVRGSRLSNVTTRFTDIIALYRTMAPFAPMVFDYSPNSAAWAIEKRFPISSNCINSPGKDLGFEIFCDICDE